MFLIKTIKLLKPNQLYNVTRSFERLLLATTSRSTTSQSSASCYCTQSTNNQPKLDTKDVVNPFKLVEDDLKNLYADIRKELWTDKKELSEIASYYFDAQGKAFRPMIVVLMARALNYHANRDSKLNDSQKVVSMVTEMIHTASLIHDDVIDMADMRRGKPSVNVIWGPKKSTLAGDFVLSRASQLLAKLRNEEVIKLISQSINDLVKGEFMQMGSKEKDLDRFSHYIEKTFNKTASLIAYTCKAVAILSNKGQVPMDQAAFEYGSSLGIAFQLVDDLLDFISSESELGKPAAADLKLGLATAPVLFASEKYPELKEMIERRFTEPGDVEKAYRTVLESDGIEQTRNLARKHINQALKYIEPLSDCIEKRALIQIAEITISRKK